MKQLADEVRALRTQIGTPRLPPPPRADVLSVQVWGRAVQEAMACLQSAEGALGKLRQEVLVLTKTPRPIIAPAPVPRKPLPETLPYEGRYYRAALVRHDGMLGTDRLSMPLGDHRIGVHAGTWYAWLGGDVVAAKEIGRVCDHYGLAETAVGDTIARLAA